MRYSLKQLMVFDAIAMTGSVSVAAEKLSLSQSATSMSLAQLEKVLGRPLFERQGKQMALTHWGYWLQPRVKRLIQDAEQIELGFYEQDSLSGEVRLGASQTPAEHLIPDLISRIDQAYPEVRVSLGVQSTQALIDGVVNYRYDIGIIEGRCDDSRIQQEMWCHDHLMIVASPNHPLTQPESVTIAQLAEAKWVLREQGSGTRTTFDSAVHHFIRDLEVYREYEQVPVLRHLVIKNEYLSCLPYLDVEQYIKQGQLVALNVPQLEMNRTISFIWRADMADNPLVECIKQQGLHMMQSISSAND
ncbi:LysR family transcriptional regulator [Vibrio sp. 10N.286.49.B3]|uniref:LysR substrate-binding domain-containing protein n=1 Tax=Vibrio sp. 10N.286.49.B3 TaxID=1880855 RepID=UPI000C81A29B|nr:LysR substrate-binding domain-containing protein [Vibrio sp. 10N.286.49.B3]PMH41400.1 LysR family transcriptional regulator [Vibrio sp. 10N.286.49.B3]